MRIALVGTALATAIACGSPVRAADIAAGKAKAELCVGCHGENGISQMENIPSLAAPARSVHPVAARVLPRRRPQERADAADRRAAQQRGHPQPRRLLCVARRRRRRPSLTTIRISRRRARRPPSAGAARHAIPTAMPAPKRSPASPASARNISSRRCATTRRACDPAAPWRRWRMSPIPLSEEEIEALAHYLAHL